MTSLYAIAAAYRADLAVLADLDIDPVTAADTIEGMQGELTDKLRAVIAYSLELDIEAVGTEQAARRMADLAKARRSRVDWLRAYALNTMQATGINEVLSDEFAAKLVKNPAGVVIAPDAAIPDAYMRAPQPPPMPQPDKAALKKAIEAGAIFDGVSLSHGYRLAIK